MSTAAFFELFESLSESALATDHLRTLVLRMAIEGKLVQQQPSDEPASALLERIKQRRANGKRRPKPPCPIHNKDLPFPLPKGWGTARLIELGEFINGDRGKNYPNKSALVPEGVPFINAGHLSGGHVDLSKMNFITEERFGLLNSGKVAPGDVLYCLRGSLGKAGVIHDIEKGAIASSLLIIRPEAGISSDFLYYFLIGPYGRSLIHKYDNGSAQPNLSATNVQRYVVPVPPAREQERIVKKTKELLALCDELEAKQEKKRQVRTRLNQACLDSLLTAQTPDEFAEHWQRIHDNFDLLYDTADSLASLREALRELAVTGRLHTPVRAEESALQLLVRIADQSDATHAENQLRYTKSIAPLSEDDYLFQAPRHWAWGRFGHVADIASGVTKGRNLGKRETALFPYLRVANVQRGYLDLRQIKEIILPVDELNRYRLQTGDILLTEGGDWDKLGRSAIWTGEIDPCLHQNHIFRARPFHAGLRARWIVLLTNSPVGRRYFADAAKQTTNLASINMTQLRALPVPIPPTAEQDAILTRLDELLLACDHLEKLLHARESTATTLLSAIIHALSSKPVTKLRLGPGNRPSIVPS